MIETGKDNRLNLLTGRIENDNYIRLYKGVITEGFIAELKPTTFTVFLIIQAFTDTNGYCEITRSGIAKYAGISKTAVNKAIKELREFEIAGKSVLSVKFH
ncbi:helix-turn-helix domain-containing protein [Virgibacillus flavescens]|uniref:helix-turn-helix domain-containing protein n=1 Tax=Virgibacillus flavescens TaxID=1611422 RepID=UPI003D356C5F